MTYLQVPVGYHGPTQTAVDTIVIHGTVSPCRVGQAARDAGYITSVGLSVHWLVDPATTVGQCPEHLVAWHDGYNLRSVGVEFTDPQGDVARFGRAAADPRRWQDDDHQAMLHRGADLVRGICQRWNVPKMRVTSDLRMPPVRGICGHLDVSTTYRLSNHVDPGPDFPWGQFLTLVNGTTPAPAAPTPKPAPPTNGDDMLLVKLAGKRAVYASNGTHKTWVRTLPDPRWPHLGTHVDEVSPTSRSWTAEIVGTVAPTD